MPQGSEKLVAGLEILEAMAGKMAEQLPDEDIFWPRAWQPVYPQADYWWLYGQLTERAA